MPGTKSPKAYYWDACIFLAWLKDEKRKNPTDLEGIENIVASWKRGDCRVITSALTYTELLEFPSTATAAFEKAMRGPNMRTVNVDHRIAKLAAELRRHYATETPTLKTPDAIHIATALHCQADMFHTFDEQLLKYGNSVAGHAIRIEKPFLPGPGRLL